MKPPRSILDPRFVYHGSAQTDLKKTFSRIRKAMKQVEQTKPLNVAQLTRKTK